MNRKPTSTSGQSTVEFVGVLMIGLLMLFGMIDFGRLIFTRQILVNITREGANLASRGTALTNALQAVVTSSQPLNMDLNGRVIITAVFNTNGVYRITAQNSRGALSDSSRIGTGVGSSATLPSTTVPIPQPRQTLYTAEAFYRFTPITPLWRFLNLNLNYNVYDVAYF
jgi:Flp pilus assembly protein TadG